MLIVVNPGMVLTSLTKSSPVVAREQEVDARHARQPSTARNASTRQPPDLRSAVAAGAAPESAVCDAVVEVFRFVVVELARRDDLRRGPTLRARRCRARRTRSRGRSGTAASMTILRSNCSASSIAVVELGVRCGLRDADARAEVGRLDEHRIAQLVCGRASVIAAGSRSHSRRSTDEMRDDGRPAAANSVFITALSMPTADPRTPAADVGDVGELEQPLHGAVLAVRPVQNREDDVEAGAGDGGGGLDRLQAPRSALLVADRAGGQRRRRLAAQRPPPALLDADRDGSYSARSRCLKMEAAEATETSCSPDRPP